MFRRVFEPVKTDWKIWASRLDPCRTLCCSSGGFCLDKDGAAPIPHKTLAILTDTHLAFSIVESCSNHHRGQWSTTVSYPLSTGHNLRMQGNHAVPLTMQRACQHRRWKVFGSGRIYFQSIRSVGWDEVNALRIVSAASVNTIRFHSCIPGVKCTCPEQPSQFLSCFVLPQTRLPLFFPSQMYSNERGGKHHKMRWILSCI